MRRYLLTSIMLLLGAGAAQAENLAKPRHNMFELGFWLGAFLPDADEHEFYDSSKTTQQPLSKLAPDVGVRLGYYPLSFFGIEGEAGWIMSETKAGDGVNIFPLRVQGVLQLPMRVTPFAVGGVQWNYSRTNDDVLGNDRDFDWHVGGGLKAFVTKNFALRLEGRLNRGNRLRSFEPGAGLDENGETNHVEILLGATFAVGLSDKSEPAANPDPDGDGVLGSADACPMEAAQTENGCPAGDSDGDGLADNVDKCPTEQESQNGFEDEDGCPDQLPDPDGDGIRGAADKCPEVAEDKDGFQDEDGCVEDDNDQDQLLDTADNCPDQVGPPENRGCPDTDRDSDGIVDRLDNCPDEVGKAEFQGCKNKQLVVIKETNLQILDKVYFTTGKATIQKRSFKLLDNIVSVLNAHPEIKKIRVEGHTDDKGADDKNKSLSQARADSVVAYLIGKGVLPERLEAVGFGEEKPIDTNKNEKGRAANRRVEFNIVEQGQVAPAAAPAAPAAPAPAAPAAPAPAAPAAPAPTTPK